MAFKKKAAKADAPAKLGRPMQVRRKCTLLWTKPLTPRTGPPRGREGYVVDLDAPFEEEWCKGQEFKLEPAPDATETGSLDESPAAMNKRKKAMRGIERAQPEPVEKATRRTAAAKADETASDAMAPAQSEFGDAPMTPEATS